MTHCFFFFSKKFTDTDGFTVRGARLAHSHRSLSISFWYADEECFIYYLLLCCTNEYGMLISCTDRSIDRLKILNVPKIYLFFGLLRKIIIIQIRISSHSIKSPIKNNFSKLYFQYAYVQVCPPSSNTYFQIKEVVSENTLNQHIIHIICIS